MVSNRPIPITAICVPMSGKARRKRAPVSIKLLGTESGAFLVIDLELLCTD